MDNDTYARVAAEVARQSKTMQWLASEVGIQPSALSMWRKRGVPRSKYPAIAVALGQTVEWLMGTAQRTPERPLSPMALRLAREFDTISDPERQLDAWARCLTAIGRAADGGPGR